MPAALRFILFACLAPLVPEVAHALPDLPEKMQDAASIPCLPHCTLCHRDDNGGAATVDQPFGKIFIAAGGLSDHRAALQRLKDGKTDSDGDGVIDVDELAAGTDPNSAYDASLCGPTVGCGIAHPGARAPYGLALLTFALASLLDRLRPRKTPPK